MVSKPLCETQNFLGGCTPPQPPGKRERKGRGGGKGGRREERFSKCKCAPERTHFFSLANVYVDTGFFCNFFSKSKLSEGIFSSSNIRGFFCNFFFLSPNFLRVFFHHQISVYYIYACVRA